MDNEHRQQGGGRTGRGPVEPLYLTSPSRGPSPFVRAWRAHETHRTMGYRNTEAVMGGEGTFSFTPRTSWKSQQLWLFLLLPSPLSRAWAPAPVHSEGIWESLSSAPLSTPSHLHTGTPPKILGLLGDELERGFFFSAPHIAPDTWHGMTKLILPPLPVD